MKTWMAKSNEIKKTWWLVDATDQTVGRLATEISKILRGKHRPTFTPHTDAGDFVVIVNADKVQFSGAKWLDKKYYRHSRFFGSLKEVRAEEMLEKDPTFLIKDAVRGMLPKNKLSRQLLSKLKAYPGSDHPHDAQKPQTLTLKTKGNK